MAGKRKLVIIDGYSLLFRAFYGTRYLSTSDGRPTNALFGFVSMLFTLFEQVKPEAVVVALDAPGKTFRHAEYAEYKGTRREIPAELISQLEASRELINAFNIPVLELTGYEADDIVGTVSRLAEENGYDTTVVTGDLDSLQLVDDSVHIMTTQRGVSEVKIYDIEAVKERYGFGPEHVTDYKALVGDTSDNIPGTPGIGDKSATTLIQEFGSVENILAKLDEVPEKFRKKLEGQEEQITKSKWLATIVRDAPVKYDFAPFKVSGDQIEAARNMLTGFEFRSHSRKLDSIMSAYLDGQAPATHVEVGYEPIQATLLDGVTPLGILEKWVGSNPYSILPPSQPEQASLLEEAELPQEGYVAVGNEVRKAQWDHVLALFQGKPNQLIGFDTKPFYKQSPTGLQPPLFDVAIAGYVLQSSRSNYDLDEFTRAFLDVAAPSKPEERAVALLRLHPIMQERLEKEDQTKVFQEIELPLIPLLAEMEQIGIKLSSEKLHEFSKQLQVEIEKVQQHVYELAGQDFNIGSPKQIGEVLFEKLQLPGGKKTKTGWATGVEILGELAAEHDIAQEILNYRELTKLKSTYADSLPKMVAADGRIHTTFNQTVAATGRLSSQDPNLQNIPIRTELGRQIRKAFVAEKGFILGSFDYSQIELRILAHMCEDENLVDAFNRRVDVHTVTASLMFGIPDKDVTKEQRRLAKMLNYAVLYGVTGYGLAVQLGTGFGVEEANNLIKQYNERFPKVKAFTEGMVETARSKGFTTTLCGRRRYFPDIHAGNRTTRMYAERQAMNAPIQGTAADMIKLAMLHVRKGLGTSQSRMLLQVHDELVFECADDFEAQRENVRSQMEDALPLTVPVEVDAKFGNNWLEMETVNAPARD
ncbi:DNA polymerase I [Kamptonema cortianum]|nr:DNA polymerase I [Geitlerinema splendidum]MDK3155307.1 DNA polymerase I [Kamptonema cortianum]